MWTCASIHALHLKVTGELSATAFLLAFRRFCSSRRVVPTVIFSDNAKTFKHCSKEIKGVIRAEEVRQYFTNQQITWNYIVEKAPGGGEGFWERLVKEVKRCLKKTIGQSILTLDELTAIVIEIEANRPLIYVHDDSEGVSHALTPAILIYGCRVATSPNGQ